MSNSPAPVSVNALDIPNLAPVVEVPAVSSVILADLEALEIVTEPEIPKSPAFAADNASEPASADKPIFVIFFILLSPLFICLFI